MDPSKDKSYLYMKTLAAKNYKLDIFERVSDDKFVENSNELRLVGEEIIANFSKDKNLKINFFADICSAPGVYSQIVLEKFPIITGIGISLPPEEGGVQFEFDNPKFKKIYKNILEKKYRLEIPKKLDLGMASCVSYQQDAKSAYKLNIELIIKSLYLLLDNLNKGGNLIINMTMKNIFFSYNLINILSKYFKNYKLWKSHNVWGTKNTFYFFGYDFIGNNNIINEINLLLEKINNDKSDIFTKFLGTKDEYEKINLQMRKIYQVRIDVWKKLINSQSNT
jgi:hypothetical protein